MDNFLHTVRRSLLTASVVLLMVLDSTPAKAADDHYQLSSGDKVKVLVFGQPDLSGEFQLDGTGRISLPLIKYIDAQGFTAEQLEDAIASKLRPGYLNNPRVSVEVLNYRPFYIIGEVRNPGSYPYVNGITVVNAVAIAGGYTYRAKEDNVVIIRAKDPRKEKINATRETIVLPGEVIEVPERFF